MSVFDSIIKLIKNHQTAASTAAWTSATSLNTALTLAVTNYASLAVSFYESDSGSAVLTGGVLTFEADDGSGQWYPINGQRLGSYTMDGTYTVTGGKQLWQFDVSSFTNFRIRLSTVLAQGAGTGTATGNVRVQASAAAIEPAVVVGQPTGSNLHANIDSSPARARTTDTISAAQATDALMNGTTALTPKFAKISCHTSGNNSIVAAVSAKKIRVLAVAVVVSAATNIYFVDGAGTPVELFGGSTDKINLAANGGFVLPFNPLGWFETSTTNVALNLNLSAANSAGGGITYVEV